ncbi:Pyruvate phosphate dikinase, PEP/pyruvate binding domain-containing protein [Homarus americanus]|uniref:Pyruvate phosphate dikinase, PEP/pyruvate binding domain-containing protein n=1 Tax=Homarus americanus TaxID=6706 RepID=A0A8J5JPC3_HOMAM|nr:Pyruvate phosphate dikinase, PEP/pyruvate binding domain-containing protein [Homarus americanus]
MRGPIDVWDEASPRLLAQALAHDPHTSLHTFLCREEDRYEQWGSLHGTVNLTPGADPQVWYLRGPRQHRWGLSQMVGSAMVTFNYFNNGDVISLHGRSSSTTTQYVGGFLQEACGVLRPVTSTDLDLGHLHHLPNLGNNLLIKLTAGGRQLDLWQHLSEKVTYYTGDPWTVRHVLHPTTVAATHSYGWGLTFFSDRYMDLCPVPERESVGEALIPRVVIEEGTPLVVSLDDPLCRNSLLTGGKGASLALLTAYTHLLQPYQGHYEVPSGVVVTVAAWQLQLQASPDLQQAVRAVQQAVGTAQPAQIKDACSRAVEVCQGMELCPQVADALHDALLQHLDSQPSRQRGQAVEAGMGVVVQEMVEAEAAGVMFTLDPVTGSPANITITANYGLGESVVSAAAEPDTVVVRRSWRDQLSVASRTLGAKKTKCVMKEDGGTEEVEVGEKERTQQCLSDTMALCLGRLAETVYLLQARPITALDEWTDYEVTHEQDSAVLCDHELLTRGNTGEVLPGSITPLTLSVLPPALDLAFYMELCHWERYSHTLEPYFAHLSPIYSTQVFLNMLQMQYRYNDKEMNLVNRAIDLIVYGHDVSTEQFVQWGVERFGLQSKLIKMYQTFLLLFDVLSLGGHVRRCKQKFADYTLACGWAVSSVSLYKEISRRLPDLLEVSRTHNITSKVSSSTECIAFILLGEGKKEFSKENKADMASLLSSCIGVESADVPVALKEFLAMTSEEGRVWIESHPGKVGDTFRNFLSKHGHRCIKEVMVRHPSSYNSVKEELNAHQAIDNLQSPVSHGTRRSLQFMLPICRKAVVQREATKSLFIKVIDVLRRAYRKLGQLLVSEGRLPSPDLVFYLTHPELGVLVQGPSPSLLAKAMKRQRLHPTLNQIKFPEVNIGIPKPLTPKKQNDVEVMGLGEVIMGTPVCQGVVTAPARVVTCLQEASNIQNGDILVTMSTDVGWTPYFPLLVGIVTEIGGLISHGENIILNATQGTITRLATPQPPTTNQDNNCSQEQQ